jgi:hypothetical protein
MRALRRLILGVLVTCAVHACAVAALGRHAWRRHSAVPHSDIGSLELEFEPPIPEGCQELWFKQVLNHFEWTAPGARRTFQQRYFVCRKEAWQPGAPIFFYAGERVCQGVCMHQEYR